jgi:hypothetical protein
VANPDPNDIADRIKDALRGSAADWIPVDPRSTTGAPYPATWGDAPTLHVSDNYEPSDDTPVVLIVDDGGSPMFGSSWFAGQGKGPIGSLNSPRLPLLRFTAFTKGRTAAWALVTAVTDWVNNNPAAVGITLVNDVSDPLITRDRDTGAYLASVTMPTIVRPRPRSN